MPPVTLTREQVVTRARAACGKNMQYVLGHGGMYPENDQPSKPEIGCDCSGMALWAVGTSRYHPEDPWFKATRGGWIDTTTIVLDCQTSYGLFSAVDWAEAKPGDLLVYGDTPKGQGHVGVVTEVDESGPVRVVHCSKGNAKTLGDAIAETDVKVFKRRGIVARYGPLAHQDAQPA